MTAISTQAHICPEKKKKLGAGQIILIIVMMLFVLICTLPFINDLVRSRGLGDVYKRQVCDSARCSVVLAGGVQR